MNRITPIVAHSSWTGASSRPAFSPCSPARSRRWMIARPRPTSSATAGSSRGSAYGARRRTTRCAATQSPAIQALKVASSVLSEPVTVRSTMHWATTVISTANPSSAASVPRRFGTVLPTPAAAARGSVLGPAINTPPVGNRSLRRSLVLLPAAHSRLGRRGRPGRRRGRGGHRSAGGGRRPGGGGGAGARRDAAGGRRPGGGGRGGGGGGRGGGGGGGAGARRYAAGGRRPGGRAGRGSGPRRCRRGCARAGGRGGLLRERAEGQLLGAEAVEDAVGGVRV